MKYSNLLSDLQSYAENCIAAQHYPNDYHFFNPAKCFVCGVVPLALIIEHHTGAKPGNFKGNIFGHCMDCGEQTRIFSFTGSHRKPVFEEKPACQCGSVHFLVGECERIERDEGQLGFFDEGVVVGKCFQCGQKHAFVYTD